MIEEHKERVRRICERENVEVVKISQGHYALIARAWDKDGQEYSVNFLKGNERVLRVVDAPRQDG